MAKNPEAGRRKERKPIVKNLSFRSPERFYNENQSRTSHSDLQRFRFLKLGIGIADIKRKVGFLGGEMRLGKARVWEELRNFRGWREEETEEGKARRGCRRFFGMKIERGNV